MSPVGFSKAAATTAFVLVVALIPLFVSDYRLFQFTMVIVMALAVLGLNLVLGYNGQLSLGHGAFFAIGGYVTAILIDKAGIPYWATLPISALVCLIFGFAFGIPALRLQGHHLALATFALALVLPPLLKYKGFAKLTGGVQGIVLEKPSSPFAFLNDDQWIYYFTAGIALVLFLLAWNLVRGRIGRAMIAIREHPIAASTMGVNVPLCKSITFGISSMYTGLAGSLSAIAVQYVAPDSFTIFLSIAILVGVVFGGVGTITGALFGGLFVQFVPNLADMITKAAPSAVYGVILIVAMYFMPRGCVGLAMSVRRKLFGNRTA
jgi:branched-chain amino acid transport system permease protein